MNTVTLQLGEDFFEIDYDEVDMVSAIRVPPGSRIDLTGYVDQYWVGVAQEKVERHVEALEALKRRPLRDTEDA